MKKRAALIHHAPLEGGAVKIQYYFAEHRASFSLYFLTLSETVSDREGMKENSRYSTTDLVFRLM
jgi:hypothetical protein